MTPTQTFLLGTLAATVFWSAVFAVAWLEERIDGP